MRLRNQKQGILFYIIFLLPVMYVQAQTTVHSTPLKTKSGLIYKIYTAKTGAEKAKPGEFIKYHLKYLLGPKDSLLQSSFDRIPDYAPVDTGEKVRYSFMEIVPKLSAGDSAEITISIDTLVHRNIMQGYNELFKKGSSIKGRIKLLQVFKSDSAMQADYQNESVTETNREAKTIEDFLAQNNVKAVKTKSGAYIVIQNAGDTTMMADSGKVASIKYKGYLFNGSVFDTNMDSSKGHTDPIDVAVGQHRVILGWDESLPYFGKGGKGKLLIPAMLAYGPRQMGNDIPAYSNLIFDIEVTDVKAAP